MKIYSPSDAWQCPKYYDKVYGGCYMSPQGADAMANDKPHCLCIQCKLPPEEMAKYGDNEQ